MYNTTGRAVTFLSILQIYIVSVLVEYNSFYTPLPQVNSFYAYSPSLTHTTNILIPRAVPSTSFWVESLLSVTITSLTLNDLALEQLNG